MTFKINFVSIPFVVIVAHNVNDVDFKKSMKPYLLTNKEIKLLTLSETCPARTIKSNYNYFIIKISKINSKYKLIDTIVHESSHAVDLILDEIGINFEIGISDEIYAYLKGFLVSEICKKLKIWNN